MTWTGSLHIVEVPSADVAREFVEYEPYDCAGLFDAHLIDRFKNLLGRTMWDSPQESVDPRFMVIAHLRPQTGEHAPAVSPADFTALPRERLTVHGEVAGADHRFDVEIHGWEFGGRR